MNLRPHRSVRIFLPAFIALLTLLTSCGEEDFQPASPPAQADTTSTVVNETHVYVNSWIRENMEYWYLWNDALPASADMGEDPETFFKSLLHREDRFSWIQEDYRELLNSLQGITREAGYEYVLYREKEGSDNVILQILYVKPDSPAEETGLNRGDIITHINGEQITTQNYKNLLTAIRGNHTIQYKPLLVEEEKFGNVTTVSLTATEYAENPNYLHRVIDAGGKKIGYFVYNFFAAGTDSEPGKYDTEMDAIFAEFKARGISDLVIDLRFNSGGSENSAKNLASLIGRGIDNTSIFLKREYNDLVKASILNDKDLGEDFLTSEFVSKQNNIGNVLTSGRVYVLTSSRTASASELIINALKPFMDVFLIGDKTYGKNVGSISLFEEDDPKNLWGLQPIVVKVYNSLGQSDYSTGFTPDVLHKDNGIILYPLGDPREALLSQAVAQITGTATTAREGEGENRKPVAHSLDFKRRSFNLVMDDEPVISQ